MGAATLPIASSAQVRRVTLGLLRQDSRALVVVIGLYLLATLAGLAGPYLMGRIVDGVRTGISVGTIDKYALIIGGFVLLQLLLTMLARYAGHRFGERILARLREDFVDSTLRLPVSLVERAGTGELMTRSAVDVPNIGSAARDAVPEIFISGLQVVVILGAIFVLDPVLGVCGLVGVPVLVWVTRWYLRRARSAYLAEGEAMSVMTQELASTTQGARTVEALDLAEQRIAAADSSVGAAFARRRASLRLRTVFFPVVDFSHTLPVVLVLLVGGLLFGKGWVSLGTVIAATLYLWQMVDPLDRVLQWAEQLQSGWASLARLTGVAEVPPAVKVTSETPQGETIRVEGVRYAYRDRDVLHDIDLTVRPGERLALVGPSGAGKSTLGRLIAGIDPPRTGRVTVGGVPVSELEPIERHKRVALVTQEHHVFVGTLRENLILAAPQATDAEVLSALRTVDAGWLSTLPDGLDTELGDGALELDPGQAQQLALARIVLADPQVLILDEATAMLDPTTARHAERSLASVLSGRTVIAIAHRLNTAHDADRVAVLEAGRIVELGSHDDLVAANGVYADLWQTWHDG
jgi:ATP-binding cassette subfamily C protein